MFSFRTTPLEVQLDKALLDGRVGCFCNQNCFDTKSEKYMYEIFRKRGNLARLFMPSSSELTPGTDHIEFSQSDLEGLDAVVVEIQDVGVRYFNFTRDVMRLLSVRARMEDGPAIYVVDHFNPLGRIVEGTMPAVESDIWTPKVAHRHALTLAELCNLYYGDLLDEVVAMFPEGSGEEEEDDRPRIAIVGKPNVGKSSIINKLIGENRLIVSDIAGTTRDAVDTAVKYNGKEYIFIDTAGLRRKNKIKEELERFMIIRTVSAVERADVVVLVIDGAEGVTEQDAKIAGIAHDRGKGIIVAVNKWDAVEKNDKTIYRFTENVRNTLSFMPYAEIIFVSAKTGQRLNKLYETIDMVIENQTLRVGTGVLNEIMMEAVALQQPPTDKGKRLRLYYITQVSVKPPTFVIFVNEKYLMHFSYQRYIENQIRQSFGFRGTPLHFIIRERKDKDA